jgi:hypothetical protein
MGQVKATIPSIDKYNESLELATGLGLKVVDVAIIGKWKDKNGATYETEYADQDLHWIGQEWVFVDTNHGLKKCKPKPVAGSRGKIVVTFTDE